ncbi:MAG: sigma-70 family RNA polymerase sigma factor [Ruminococcaceae bacterium]|nr:sigma-70 family RNA polymerase sigma factor [Oscillospiraceae bacterium]
MKVSDRTRLIEENIGLAHSCVKRYLGRGIEYDDLLQTACLGLVKAADGFDESRGLRFSTYAVPVILGEIKHMFRSSSLLKVSRELQRLGIQAAEAQERFSQQYGRNPQISELSAMLEVTPEEAAQALCAAQRPASLSQPEEDDAPATEIPVQSFDGELIDCIALGQAVAKLCETDRRLIEERYIRGSTQTVTAAKLGMTQVQVSRREKKILARLRELMQ